jgi:hypothetical protein
MPYFTREQARAVAEVFPRIVHYDAARDVFRVYMGDDSVGIDEFDAQDWVEYAAEPETTVDGVLALYALGNGSWTWETEAVNFRLEVFKLFGGAHIAYVEGETAKSVLARATRDYPDQGYRFRFVNRCGDTIRMKEWEL